MYLIIRHDFDNMENRYPERTKIIGYIKDGLDADAWCMSQNYEQYRGWDGKLYPYYTKQKIEKINI